MTWRSDHPSRYLPNRRLLYRDDLGRKACSHRPEAKLPGSGETEAMKNGDLPDKVLNGRPVKRVLFPYYHEGVPYVLSGSRRSCRTRPYTSAPWLGGF